MPIFKPSHMAKFEPWRGFYIWVYSHIIKQENRQNNPLKVAQKSKAGKVAKVGKSFQSRKSRKSALL